MTAQRDPHVSVEEFEAMFEAARTWGRWGADDQRGRPELHQRRAGHGRGRPGTHRHHRQPGPAAEHRGRAGQPQAGQPLHDDAAPTPTSGPARCGLACDYVGMEFHGDAHSHIDALCHVIYEDQLHNGVAGLEGAVDRRAGAVDRRRGHRHRRPRGAARHPAAARRPVARAGRLRLRPRTCSRPRRPRACELRQGDVLYLRTGPPPAAAGARPVGRRGGEGRAALQRDAAAARPARSPAFGADGDGDAVPNDCDAVIYPIHVLGVNAMGLHFMDSLQFEDLAAACEEEQRWEFMTVDRPAAAGQGHRVAGQPDRDLLMAGRRHVVIVGGGIIGLSTAWFLSQGGAQVTVLEARTVGSGSSFANGGWLCPAQAGPLAEPGLTLFAMRSFLERDSRALHQPAHLPHAAGWFLQFRRYCTTAAFTARHGGHRAARAGHVHGWSRSGRRPGVELRDPQAGHGVRRQDGGERRRGAGGAAADARVRLRAARRPAHRERAARVRAGAVSGRSRPASTSTSTGTSAPTRWSPGWSAWLRERGHTIHEGAEVTGGRPRTPAGRVGVGQHADCAVRGGRLRLRHRLVDRRPWTCCPDRTSRSRPARGTASPSAPR